MAIQKSYFLMQVQAIDQSSFFSCMIDHNNGPMNHQNSLYDKPIVLNPLKPFKNLPPNYIKILEAYLRE